MIKNIIHVAGTHGSGKSTLIRKLVEYDSRYEASQRPPIPKSEVMMERNLIRAARYFFQSFYDVERTKKNIGKIILCDRSIVDNMSYLDGFLRLHWISKEEYEQTVQVYNTLFPPERKPQNIVFIDPALEFTIQNIKRRWDETGEKKWREDDFVYLIMVKEAFRSFLATYEGNVLHLREENLEKRVQIVDQWARQL